MSFDPDAALAGEIAGAAGSLLLDLRAQAAAGAEQQGAALGAAGDLRANELILGRLADARPGDAVLSEESADDPARLDTERVWIVDPLDGTREYAMPGRDDWAVHVALWVRGTGIAAAAVAQPALGAIYVSGRTTARRGPVPTPARIVVSDSRPPPFIGALCAAVDAVSRPMGSAGAKAMAVVRGEAEAYVHAGGQWEWDSAAPVGVALAAGLHASRLDGSALLYNQADPYLPDLLICRAELARPYLAALGTL